MTENQKWAQEFNQSNARRTWELVPLAPVAYDRSVLTIGYGTHPPMVTDIMRKLTGPIVVDGVRVWDMEKPTNIAMSIVNAEYRVLSFDLGGTPYVYAIIAFDRRAA